jgi:hypothetical protein
LDSEMKVKVLSKKNARSSLDEASRAHCHEMMTIRFLPR